MEVYKVPFPWGLQDEAGWTLERYEFKRLASGDSFFLHRRDLEKDEGLKRFLGFRE